MATSVLKEGGVVFGAALDFEDGHAHPHHVAVRELSQLYRLQGSKYVQSAIENTYMEAKKELDSGKKVLFSGTPCQIAGLYGYLRKEYENLCTVDVICHGVPSARMFDDFLQNECGVFRSCNKLVQPLPDTPHGIYNAHGRNGIYHTACYAPTCVAGGAPCV